MTEPCDLSLLAAAELIRVRCLSPVDLLESVLARIDRTEPVLHAYVIVDRDRALADARAAELAIADGTYRGPLHGMPIAVKDIFDVAGLPTRCGSRVREHAAPASTDAPSVAAARAAGAVILGKTVTQEFAAGVVSVPSRNPWNPDRIPGGSSGGTGAAVAAGSAMAGFGSDTGGSIRNPASLNGVVGLKPTYGSVSKRGVFPLAWSLDTVGPLTRRVADAAVFFNAIAGHDPLDPGSAFVPASDATSEIGQSVDGLRIGMMRPFFFDRLQPDVARAVEAAYEHMDGLGAEMVEAPWADAAIARAASFVINRVEAVEVHAKTIRTAPELLGDELRLRLESNSLYPAAGYLRALRAREYVKVSIARLFAEHRLDAIVVPASPGTAAMADDLHTRYEDGTSEPVGLSYTRLTMPFNATGQPSLVLPCGFDCDGLPIGMQIVGRPFAEARICRIGHAYETTTGWTERRPPLLDQNRRS